ncbi:MAG: acyl-CoA carboxylase epsilon subunit [Dehalococcoidia bacterium]
MSQDRGGPSPEIVAAIVAALTARRRRATAAITSAPRSPWKMAGRQRAMRPR